MQSQDCASWCSKYYTIAGMRPFYDINAAHHRDIATQQIDFFTEQFTQLSQSLSAVMEQARYFASCSALSDYEFVCKTFRRLIAEAQYYSSTSTSISHFERRQFAQKIRDVSMLAAQLTERRPAEQLARKRRRSSAEECEGFSVKRSRALAIDDMDIDMASSHDRDWTWDMNDSSSDSFGPNSPNHQRCWWASPYRD